MRIGALDLSWTGTGCAYSNEDGYIVEEIGSRASAEEERYKRLQDLSRRILAFFPEVPEFVFMEGYSMNARNGREMAGELGGVVRLDLYQSNIRIAVVPPTVLKKWATGHGGASKADMAVAAYKKFGFESKSDNIIDAFLLMKLGEGMVSGHASNAKVQVYV